MSWWGEGEVCQMNMNEEKITEFLMYLENQSGEDFKKWLTGINFFEILGISSSEIRHSRMLAWLLDPKESHKLGSEFLKKFLLKVIDRNENITEVKSVDVFLRDFSDADVYRESKNNIDIFLSSPKNKFNLVIENKIFTSDHDNQLEKYRIYTEKEYPDFKNLYVYLTPNGNAPINASDDECRYWRVLSYKEISLILNDIINGLHESSKVRFVIKEYNDNLRRNILNDEELKQLSADIYFKYKEVLDLIINNKPDAYSEIRESFIKILNDLNQEGKIIYDGNHDDSSLIRFRTKVLDVFFNNKISSDNGWGGSLYYYEIDQWKSLPIKDIQVKLSIVNSTSYASEEQTENIRKFTHGRYYKGKKLSNDKDSYNCDYRFSKLELEFEDIWGGKMEHILRNYLEKVLNEIVELEETIING